MCAQGYPADDVDALLGGQMATAEGICALVEDGLRCWALEGPLVPFCSCLLALDAVYILKFKRKCVHINNDNTNYRSVRATITVAPNGYMCS